MERCVSSTVVKSSYVQGPKQPPNDGHDCFMAPLVNESRLLPRGNELGDPIGLADVQLVSSRFWSTGTYNSMCCV